MKTVEERLQKLERRKKLTWVENAILLMSLFLLCFIVYTGINQMFSPPQNKTIQFEVTGIVNDTNATTLTQLHFECIKFCENAVNYIHDCWKECANLGNELK